MNETLNGFARLITALLAVDAPLARDLVEALQKRLPSAIDDLVNSRDTASDLALSEAIHALLEQYHQPIEAALSNLERK